MKKFENIDQILDFAILNEQIAYDFYTKLSENSKHEYIKNIFIEFAGEEKKHKEILQAIKEGKNIEISGEKVKNLNIDEYLEISSKNIDKMSFEDALLLAMKREKSAYRLYMLLAEQTDSIKMRNIFEKLANEEAKHKLRFETEYDDYVYREN